MDFPVADLLDDELSEQRLLKHFHPKGLKCPHCATRPSRARAFRRTRRSQVTVYRCHECQGLYNAYSGTVFQARHLRPSQVVLLLRGVCKGEPTAGPARELGLPRSTVHGLRRQLQQNAQALQPGTPLPDDVTETDEMFQNAGGEGEKHADPADPPRRRANKRRGHGTYQNDRPPVVGTVGRTSGQVRLRVVKRTDGATLKKHVERFTHPGTRVCTDEWRGYNNPARPHATAAHGRHEWARDDDGDGVREVHTNTVGTMRQPAKLWASYGRRSRAVRRWVN